MATVHFTSSDTFLGSDPKACEHAEVEIVGYIEGTYDMLRHSGDNDEGAGEVIAHFLNDAWELIDGRRFSDWAVEIN